MDWAPPENGLMLATASADGSISITLDFGLLSDPGTIHFAVVLIARSEFSNPIPLSKIGGKGISYTTYFATLCCPLPLLENVICKRGISFHECNLYSVLSITYSKSSIMSPKTQ